MDWMTWVKAKLDAVCGFYFIDESHPKYDSHVKTHPARAPAQTGKIPARRMWPFGIRSLPPAGVECITVGPMASQQKVIIAAESNGYGPTDLQEGEVAIYNGTYKEGAVCVIKLDKDGAINILAKAESSIKLDKDGNIALKARAGKKVTIDAGLLADVQVNGGTAEVARAGDSVTITGTDSVGGAINATGVIAAGATFFKA